jgi:2-polyprenyl-6-methoxyphenol hydroxylase-like FAD-dependent oxidoreductase
VKATICGAGIAGLTLAWRLERNDWAVVQAIRRMALAARLPGATPVLRAAFSPLRDSVVVRPVETPAA